MRRLFHSLIKLIETWILPFANDIYFLKFKQKKAAAWAEWFEAPGISPLLIRAPIWRHVTKPSDQLLAISLVYNLLVSNNTDTVQRTKMIYVMRKWTLVLCGGVRSLYPFSSLYYDCATGEDSVETTQADVRARLSHRCPPIRRTIFTLACSNIARTSVTHLYQ